MLRAERDVYPSVKERLPKKRISPLPITSGLKRVAKIVPTTPFTPLQKKIPTRQAVITPVKSPVPIVIEKERQEIVKSFEPKKIQISEERKSFMSKFKSPLELAGFGKHLKNTVLGVVAPTPRAMPRALMGVSPAMKKTILSRTSPPPKKADDKPIYRKNFIDIPKAVDKPILEPEKVADIAPKTKNFLEALLPGLALFFLKK